MTLLLNSSNSVFGRFLSHRLSKEGNSVTVVTDDRTMVEEAFTSSYDAVMVVSDRFSIWRFNPVRRLTNHTKVIILSSVFEEKCALEAFYAGVSVYLTLPVDPSRLIRKLTEIV